MQHARSPALLLALALTPIACGRTPAPEPAATSAPAPITPAPPPTASATTAAPPTTASAAAPSAPRACDHGNLPIHWTSALKLQNLDALPAAMTEELKPNGEPLTMPGYPPITNCEQYLKAHAAGAEPENTFEITQESFFIERCTGLWFVREACRAKESYLGDLSLAPKPLSVLPARLHVYPADIPAEEQAIIDRGEALSAIPGLKLKKSSKTSATWIDKTAEIQESLDLIAFGDLDRDGIEDVLAFKAHHSLQGSFRGYHYVVLTRTAKDAKLTVLRKLD